MADHIPRNRLAPVARFNTFEVSEQEIKAQIERASKQQRAVRAHASRLWYSRSAISYEHDDSKEDTTSFDCPRRSESLNTLTNSLRGPIDRAPSFDSLSTLQRHHEAARISQYRGSPVSVCTGHDRAAAQTAELALKTEGPCPPLSVYKLKQARKDEKLQKRNLRRLQKEQKSTEQSSLKAAKSVSSKDQQTCSHGTCVPARAVSDPSFKRPRDAAAQLVKRLTMSRPLSRLTRRGKAQDSPKIPHLDEFDSKPALETYLNSPLPESKSHIAELPGSLPPYTAFQDCTSNVHNIPIPVSNEAPTGTPLLRSHSSPGHQRHDSTGSPKMMRCDDCEFGIKLEEPYFQCSICNNGDRILCSGCDAAGRSCRHELTERVRRVLRYDDGIRQSSSVRDTAQRASSNRRQDSTQTCSDKSLSLAPAANFELHSTPAAPKQSGRESDRQSRLLQTQELELRKREQDVIIREKEASLREREADIRAREAELSARTQVAELNMRGDFMRQCIEMATCLGSQFASLSRAGSNASNVQASPEPESNTEPITLDDAPPSTTTVDIFNTSSDDSQHIRNHASKRKASTTQRAAIAEQSHSGKHSTNPGRAYRKGSDDDYDADENASGTPKRMKPDNSDPTLPENLYACHYCKKDPIRYSEQNNQEKNYRGCSSGYWPDISRLKQHLYRVHWRSRCCKTCHTVFKTDAELAQHSQTQCTAQDCPFPEKFDEIVYNEIKRKRPAKGPEEVWYIIWDLIFPDEGRPLTPFQANPLKPSAKRDAVSTDGTQSNLAALPSVFAEHLQRGAAEQSFLQDPSARAYIQQVLRASMQDMMRQMQNSPRIDASGSEVPSERSPVDREMRRPSLQLSEAPSISASPLPMSAIERSPSHGQFLLPSHRRSFSRPLINKQQPRSEGSFDDQTTDSALTSAMDTTPSDGIFHVATPLEAETDQWDHRSGSWRQGDEFQAFDTNNNAGFDFNFPSPSPLAKTYPPPQFSGTSNSAGMSSADYAMMNENQYVGRAATLPFHPQGVYLTAADQKLKACQSEASLDSGYGSLASRSRPQGLALAWDIAQQQQQQQQQEQQQQQQYHPQDNTNHHYRHQGQQQVHQQVQQHPQFHQHQQEYLQHLQHQNQYQFPNQQFQHPQSHLSLPMFPSVDHPLNNTGGLNLNLTLNPETETGIEMESEDQNINYNALAVPFEDFTTDGGDGDGDSDGDDVVVT